MTTITATEAISATVSEYTLTAEELDTKYSIFNTVVRSKALSKEWSIVVEVATVNAAEFRAWAQTLGYSVISSVSDSVIATNVDGSAGRASTKFLVSWRKITAVTLTNHNTLAVNEGDVLDFVITGQGWLAGDRVYWTNIGTTNSEDFGLGPPAARPQGPWLTVKTIDQWAGQNAAMARLIRLRTNAEGNIPLVARYTQQIAELKLSLEYQSGLTSVEYSTALQSEYQGSCEFGTAQDTVVAGIRLLVFKDKTLEAAVGITEVNETLIIKIWADVECTQPLFTAATITIYNEA